MCSLKAWVPHLVLFESWQARIDGSARRAWRILLIALLKAIEYFGVPKARALFENTYFIGLHKAGMPEE